MYQTIHVDVIHDTVDSIQLNFVYKDYTEIQPADITCDESTIVLAVFSKFGDDALVEFVSNIPDRSKLCKVYAVSHKSYKHKQQLLDRTDIFDDFIQYLKYDMYPTIVRIINNRLSIGVIEDWAIIAHTVVRSISMYVEPVNNCVTLEHAIDLIISRPQSIRSKFILHHVRKQSYRASTTTGAVEIKFVNSLSDQPDVHAVVCKRHDAYTHLSESSFHPNTLSAVFLITKRHQCTITPCDMYCNSEWSLFNTTLQRIYEHLP